jgi:hypothetical protein
MTKPEPANTATDAPTQQPAVGAPLERDVWRLEPERATVGDVVAVDVRHPYPQTLRLTLETQAATDYANKLLARAGSGWRLAPLAMPAACTTPRGCRDHGCHGACLPPNDRIQPRR